MPGHAIGAEYHDLNSVAVLEQRRRGVRIARFSFCIGGTIDAPDRFAGLLVDSQKVGRLVGLGSMHHLQEDRVSAEQRRGAITVIQPEPSVISLNVARPEFIPLEIEAL